MSGTQRVVVGFFAFVWLALAAILALAPEIYTATLPIPAAAFFAAISALVAVLVVAVVRRWRWAFWLLVVAFVGGALRVPAAVLELAGLVPAAGPAWYVAFQGCIGLAQLAIGIALIAEYRRAGVWGRRAPPSPLSSP